MPLLLTTEPAQPGAVRTDATVFAGAAFVFGYAETALGELIAINVTNVTLRLGYR